MSKIKTEIIPTKRKPKIKVTTETIRMRYDIARKDAKFFKENGRIFSFKDASKMFNISKQLFWYFHSENPLYSMLPSKKKCTMCGGSMYNRFSEWINDGSLNHLLKGMK